MPENPLLELLSGQLPELDFGIMQHGFADHGRDYVFIIQNPFGPQPGTYALQFTHVVNLEYETRVGDEIWQRSWGDEFIDYKAWEQAGDPDGYVFGTNWTLAYPGVSIPTHSPQAEAWSTRLERPMYAALIESDRFLISLIFHDVRLRQVSSDASTVSQVLIPLNEWRGWDQSEDPKT